MTRSRKQAELTEKLQQIRDRPTSEVALPILRQILASNYATMLAQVAGLIGQHEIRSLLPELVAAFNRLIAGGKEKDPGCMAKHRIAETLYRLDYRDEEIFLAGIRYVQLEPIWGGQVDTAPRLRGTCALGLVRMNSPSVMVELADLLADPEPEARIGAARAIAYWEDERGVPLLRLRVQIGDTLPVLSECLIALLKLAPVQSLPLVQRFLYARQGNGTTEDIPTAEVAALALGESRCPDALSVLRDWWQQVRDPQLKQTALLAIATLRVDEAIAFLLSLVSEGRLTDATSAIEALGLYRHEAALWQQVQQRVEHRGEATLLERINGHPDRG